MTADAQEPRRQQSLAGRVGQWKRCEGCGWMIIENSEGQWVLFMAGYGDRLTCQASDKGHR